MNAPPSGESGDGFAAAEDEEKAISSRVVVQKKRGRGDGEGVSSAATGGLCNGRDGQQQQQQLLPPKTCRENFPEKLMEILSDPCNSSVISWLNHGRSFYITSPDEFTRILLPLLFGGEAFQFDFFVNRLYRWGFKKISMGPDAESYFHPQFRRDRPDMCLTIKPMTKAYVRDGCPEMSRGICAVLGFNDDVGGARREQKKKRTVDSHANIGGSDGSLSDGSCRPGGDSKGETAKTLSSDGERDGNGHPGIGIPGTVTTENGIGFVPLVFPPEQRAGMVASSCYYPPPSSPATTTAVGGGPSHGRDGHPQLPLSPENRPKKLPEKLMEVLSDPYNDEVISWLDHGLSFNIIFPEEFALDILPSLVGSESGRNGASQYQSFVQRLYRWGFKQISEGPDAESFYHPEFRRDRPDLCLGIQPMAKYELRRERERSDQLKLPPPPPPPRTVDVDTDAASKLPPERRTLDAERKLRAQCRAGKASQFRVEAKKDSRGCWVPFYVHEATGKMLPSREDAARFLRDLDESDSDEEEGDDVVEDSAGDAIATVATTTAAAAPKQEKRRAEVEEHARDQCPRSGSGGGGGGDGSKPPSRDGGGGGEGRAFTAVGRRRCEEGPKYEGGHDGSCPLTADCGDGDGDGDGPHAQSPPPSWTVDDADAKAVAYTNRGGNDGGGEDKAQRASGDGERDDGIGISGTGNGTGNEEDDEDEDSVTAENGIGDGSGSGDYDDDDDDDDNGEDNDDSPAAESICQQRISGTGKSETVRRTPLEKKRTSLATSDGRCRQCVEGSTFKRGHLEGCPRKGPPRKRRKLTAEEREAAEDPTLTTPDGRCALCVAGSPNRRPSNARRHAPTCRRSMAFKKMNVASSDYKKRLTTSDGRCRECVEGSTSKGNPSRRHAPTCRRSMAFRTSVASSDCRKCQAGAKSWNMAHDRSCPRSRFYKDPTVTEPDTEPETKKKPPPKVRRNVPPPVLVTSDGKCRRCQLAREGKSVLHLKHPPFCPRSLQFRIGHYTPGCDMCALLEGNGGIKKGLRHKPGYGPHAPYCPRSRVYRKRNEHRNDDPTVFINAMPIAPVRDDGIGGEKGADDEEEETKVDAASETKGPPDEPEGSRREGEEPFPRRGGAGSTGPAPDTRPVR